MLKLLNFSCSRCSFPSDHSDHFLVNINIRERRRPENERCRLLRHLSEPFADAIGDAFIHNRDGAPLVSLRYLLGHMLSVAAQFCAQRALKDSSAAWTQRADVLRTASDALYEIENHPRENVREAFERRMEQKLVEYDREQRGRGVTSVPVSYTPEATQRDDRQFVL